MIRSHAIDAGAIRRRLSLAAGLALCAGLAAPLGAQADTTRLREALPDDIGRHVLAQAEAARREQLPADALLAHALLGIERGAAPSRIDAAVADHLARLRTARTALVARDSAPSDADVAAGAEVLRRGVSGADVAALAASAPSGRSLAMPLYTVAALMDRGLPADEALSAVRARLLARVTDEELSDVGEARGRARGGAARALPLAAPPARGGGGPPSRVPANAGREHGRGRGSKGAPSA